MVKLDDRIPDKLISWIEKQEIFFVATAPLTKSGHVNVSPKGVRGSFHIANRNRVWYEDLSGSGIETISHLRENGRITIMFCALEGAAQVVRLYGTGTVYEFGTPQYNELIPPNLRLSGSRAAIVIDVYKTSSSCGYAVPLYEYKSPRTALFNWSEKLEQNDEAFAADNTSCLAEELPVEEREKRLYPTRSLRWWWVKMNLRSLDNLPGLSSAHLGDMVPTIGRRDLPASADVLSNNGNVTSVIPRVQGAKPLIPASRNEIFRLLLAFSAGIAVAAMYVQSTVGLMGC